MRHIQKIILDNWFQQEFIKLIHRRIQIVIFHSKCYIFSMYDEVMFIFQHFNTGNKLNEKISSELSILCGKIVTIALLGYKILK